MRFLAFLCILALATADEDTTQDKKTQQFDTIQNTSSLPTAQPTNTLLNGQTFLPTSFSSVFGTNDHIPNLAYTGFNSNVSPVQGVQPDFFVSPTAGGIQLNSGVPVNSAIPVNVGIPANTGLPVNSGIQIPVNGAVQSFPVTRTVLPGTNAVVGGIQSVFPVGSNVFPAVNTIPTQFSTIGAGILSGVPTGTIDPNTANTNGVISPVAGTSYRFLTPESFATQGLQAAQQVGLAAIPAFTSGILPSLANGVLQNQLQGQNLPAGLQQVLKNPTGNPTGISGNIQGLQGGNIPTGPLTTVFGRG